MGPTWGPPVSCRPQVGPMKAPWTLLSGYVRQNWEISGNHCCCKISRQRVTPEDDHILCDIFFITVRNWQLPHCYGAYSYTLLQRCGDNDYGSPGASVIVNFCRVGNEISHTNWRNITSVNFQALDFARAWTWCCSLKTGRIWSTSETYYN